MNDDHLKPINKNEATQPAETTGFDRQAYLKEIRSNILKNMGLPEDTRPDNVLRLLAIKEQLKKIQEQ